MYNASFYPTPPQVAKAMLARISPQELAKRTILEPSAGKGDLADAVCSHIADAFSRYGRSGDHTNKVLCIEIEPDLQAALRGKGYRIIGRDFLSWRPDEHFDCIIMNPPFANADVHLLKAWEILPEGDILCLVNTQTLENVCTIKRQELAALIEAHGETEPLGTCFTDAERKSEVHVSLVHLRKAARPSVFSFEGLERDTRQEHFDTESLEGQIATRNVIGNMVLEYEKCREIFAEIARLSGELAFYSRHLDGGTHEDRPEKALAKAVEPLFSGTPDTAALHRACSTFTQHLKRGAWHKVFQMSKFSNLVSKGVRDSFNTFCRENESLAFSEENIATLLESLFHSQGEIMRQCIIEAFDSLTEYYKENRMHAEGWKSNDSWRVNRRVVLPYCVDASWSTPTLSYSRDDKLRDLDRAMGMLVGLKLDQITTIGEAFTRAARIHNRGVFGMALESTFFEFRGYKKGTLHLYFKDKDLWEKFNVEAARGKGWLPDDTKAREKAEKEAEKARNAFADQFGLPLAV